jgi:hypothetical protein
MPNDGQSQRAPARFIPPIHEDAEDVEEYQKGGLHPVYLGEKYDGGRYEIVHKLDGDRISTVWLAWEVVSASWVALQFFLATLSRSVLRRNTLSLQVLIPHNPEAVRRLATYDRFFLVEGPNGKHLCLVFPVLGPSS